MPALAAAAPAIGALGTVAGTAMTAYNMANKPSPSSGSGLQPISTSTDLPIAPPVQHNPINTALQAPKSMPGLSLAGPDYVNSELIKLLSSMGVR